MATLTRNASAVEQGTLLAISGEERAKQDKLLEIAELGLLAGLYAILRKQRKDVAAHPDQLVTVVADYTPSLVTELRSGMDRAWQLGIGEAMAFLGVELNTRLLYHEGKIGNQAAAADLAQRLNARTIYNADAIITRWTQKGQSAKELATLLEPVYGRSRASAIAVTEMTNYHARAALRGYQASNAVIGMSWFTANDDRTCFICAPLGGLIFDGEDTQPVSIERQEMRAVRTDLYSSFTHPGGKGKAGRYAGLPFFPAAHVNCRCRIGPIVR